MKHSPFKGSHGKFLCHIGVADVVNDAHDNAFWMAQANLAAKVGVTRKTVNEFFAEAIDRGLIELIVDNSKAGKPNKYRMLLPSPDVSGGSMPFQGVQGVSPQVTPSDPPGVSRQVAPGVTSSDKGVSPQVTPGVTPGDTELNRTQERTQPITQPPPTPPQAGGGSDPVSSVAASSGEQGSLELDDDEIIEGEIVGDGEGRAGRLTVIEGRFENALDRKARAKAQKGQSQGAIAQRVFEAWCEATDRNPERVKLTHQRYSKIVARLNEGYDEADLIGAVRGIVLSPFHMGDNDRETRYDDITTVLRDGKQVEKFRDLHDRGGRADGKKMSNTDRVRAKMGLG
jgi:hypothetical protein